MKWNPIETAPKDGTKVLAYLLTYCKSIKYMDIISWDRILVEEDCRWITCHAEEVYSTPTNWMPLPEAPDYHH